MDTAWVQMKASYVPSLGTPGHVTAILHAKNWKKIDKFKRVFLVSTDIDKKKVCDFFNTLSTTFLLVIFIYPVLDTIFGTSAMLRVGKINSFSATRGQNRYNFETVEGRNLKLKS